MNVSSKLMSAGSYIAQWIEQGMLDLELANQPQTFSSYVTFGKLLNLCFSQVPQLQKTGVIITPISQVCHEAQVIYL